MDRAHVEHWVAAYERAWREPSAERLAAVFTEDASYLPSPWAEPASGLGEIAPWWDRERDEEFTMTSDIVAVEGDTAVVRTEVEYVRPDPGRWRNLWVLRFASDGRCSAFEEWPFAPRQPDGH